MKIIRGRWLSGTPRAWLLCEICEKEQTLLPVSGERGGITLEESRTRGWSETATGQTRCPACRKKTN